MRNIKSIVSGFPLGDDAVIAGVAMGLPCFGESEEGDRELLRAFTSAFSEIPLCLTNDVEVGWAGSLGLTPGINVVAGTGSIAFGKDEAGATARCGGWSEFFSDEGSCYDIGRKALQLFSKQADGRVPEDEFYSVFRKRLNIENDFDIIDIVHDQYTGSRDKVASLQFVVRDAALAGSLSARNLYITAAEELCNLVFAIRNSLNFQQNPYMVSYSGGLFKTGDLILPYFFEGIEALGGKPVSPKYEPMYGALLLAFEKSNPEGIPNLQKRLEKR